MPGVEDRVGLADGPSSIEESGRRDHRLVRKAAAGENALVVFVTGNRVRSLARSALAGSPPGTRSGTASTPRSRIVIPVASRSPTVLRGDPELNDYPVTPAVALGRVRRTTAGFLAAFPLVVGTGAAAVSSIAFGAVRELEAGAAGAGTLTLVTAMDAYLTVMVHRGDRPAHKMDFFEDARARHVLRTAGPFYQFRHARLQDLLATQAAGRSARSVAGSPSFPASDDVGADPSSSRPDR
ncbi:hypothetical protein LN042_03480 [Kitasatospora sp. RB6PN24]|uniref:hypothetical protein n=1 Tax=Kitasatospora humi TaxID=2893891 RepID=UPI001E299000|nr:hypothetical protein [Kitasatospora humi]MCC9306177.1 hypothetical protein [Kitasatospora humi]